MSERCQKLFNFIIICVCFSCANVFAQDIASLPALQSLETQEKILSNIFPDKITIEQAVQMAYENNIDLINAFLNKEKADKKLREYYSYAYPQLNLNADYSRNIDKPSFFINGSKVTIGADNEYTVGANLEQIVFSGGRVLTGIDIAKKQNVSALYSAIETKNLVRKTIYEICYRIIVFKKIYEIENLNLEIEEERLALEQERYEGGISSNLDLLRQKVRVSNAKPSVIRTKANYEISYLYLKDTLNLDPDYDLELVWDDEDLAIPKAPTLDKLYSLAMTNRPEITISRLNFEIADKRAKFERGSRWPELKLVADRTYIGQGDGGMFFEQSDQNAWSTTAGLTFSMPIWQGGKISSLISQREIDRDIAFNQYIEMLRRVRILVKESYVKLIEAQLKMQASGDSRIQARENLEGLAEQYKSGLATQIDLTEANRDFNKAQLLYLEAVYEQFNVIANLEYLTGTIILNKD